MKETIEKMCKYAEEFGDLHGKNCSCMLEYPDECDCQEMVQIRHIIEETVKAENARWVAMAEAHRPNCFSSGNKMLTKMMGKANRQLNQSNIKK